MSPSGLGLLPQELFFLSCCCHGYLTFNFNWRQIKLNVKSILCDLQSENKLFLVLFFGNVKPTWCGTDETASGENFIVPCIFLQTRPPCGFVNCSNLKSLVWACCALMFFFFSLPAEANHTLMFTQHLRAERQRGSVWTRKTEPDGPKVGAWAGVTVATGWIRAPK